MLLFERGEIIYPVDFIFFFPIVKACFHFSVAKLFFPAAFCHYVSFFFFEKLSGFLIYIIYLSPFCYLTSHPHTEKRTPSLTHNKKDIIAFFFLLSFLPLLLPLVFWMDKSHSRPKCTESLSNCQSIFHDYSICIHSMTFLFLLHSFIGVLLICPAEQSFSLSRLASLWRR